MQKVVIVNVLARTGNNPYNQIEFKELNELLVDGWKVVQFYQYGVSDQLYSVTMTFVIEK